MYQEINFALNDDEILSLLKGIEFNLIQHYGQNAAVRVRVYSKDRKKILSSEQWRNIRQMACSDPALDSYLRAIEANDDR